jgi:quercetin dioxygenase-like cupin family protein
MQSGSMKFTFDDRTEHLSKSDVLIIPPNTPHAVEVMEDSVFLDFFTPVRTDWQRGDDKYLRHDGEMKKKI